jgi:hypothetical protein
MLQDKVEELGEFMDEDSFINIVFMYDSVPDVVKELNDVLATCKRRRNLSNVRNQAL